MTLVCKRCTTCDCKTVVLDWNTTPQCSICTTKSCSLSFMPNCNNRYQCNNLGSLISRDGHSVCMAHYKKLQQHCRVCGHPAIPGDSLSYDDWYYCKHHKPPSHEQVKVVDKLLSPVLNQDCIHAICKFL